MKTTCFLIAALVAIPAMAQDSTPAATPKPISHTEDGQPNISGYWAPAVTGTYDLSDPRSGGARLQDDINAKKGLPRKPVKSRIVDPPDGKIPYQPWAAAKQAAIAANVDNPTKPEHVDTQARCLLDGAVRPFFHGPFRIVQVPGQVLVLEEENHGYRVVPLNGYPHVGPGIELWMGDSRGHWEGNTLVIDVTNLNGKPRLDMVANFYSPAAHFVERLTLVDADTFDYEVTVTDPTVYTKPWKIAARFVRPRGRAAGYEIWEDACHEGEQSADAMILRTGASEPKTK
jgi:hypothetical protein